MISKQLVVYNTFTLSYNLIGCTASTILNRKQKKLKYLVLI